MSGVNFAKLIYLPLDIPSPPSFIEYWDTLNYDELITDTYRSCWHIPMMEKNGNWTKFAEKTPALIEWYEKYINFKTRIMIITTPAGAENAKHIDCSPEMFNTVQHKIRYVFQGTVSSLVFCNKEKDEFIPELDIPFVIDGSWPHYMVNNTQKRKYTLAVGAPWEPDLTDEFYINLLNKSYIKYKEYYINSEHWNLPDNYEELYETKYKQK